MFPILILAISAWVLAQVDGMTQQYRDLVGLYQSRSRQQQIVTLAETIEQYYIETATFPASLSVLAAAPGFEQSKGAMSSWQGYAVSPTLNDGVWQFSR